LYLSVLVITGLYNSNRSDLILKSPKTDYISIDTTEAIGYASLQSADPTAVKKNAGLYLQLSLKSSPHIHVRQSHQILGWNIDEGGSQWFRRRKNG